MIMGKKIQLNERIFVAGAGGMAGSAICKKLLQLGYGDCNKNGLLLTPSRKELNLLDKQDVIKWFQTNNPSVVILAAAKVGGIMANQSYPADFLLENLKIQINVIEAAWRHKVKRFLFLGSSCIYPKYASQPIKEEYLLDGQLEKTNDCYAIAKIAGIKLCQSLNIQYGFDSICLMPTNLYGPGDNYDPINSHVMAALIKKFQEAVENSADSVTCWGSGKPLREFMHVDDLASAVVFALENWDPNSEDSPKDTNGYPLYFLNVGTGKDITIKELAERIALASGFKGKILWDNTKPDGTPKKQLNIEKIKKLGWEPKIHLENGIKETLELFKSKT